ARGGAPGRPPRGKAGAGTAAASGTRKPKRTRKPAARTASGKSATSGRSARRPSAARTEAPGTDGPKLVELVRRHLGEQSEPRSAAEVADALGRAHPGRTVKTTVVRSTLEGLVARNQAQRTKQGSSVFYTAPDGAAQATKAGEDAMS
ncbi:hypothetical protein ABTY20_33900, partial [Streptomyces sp. NPDC126497]